MTYTSPSRPSSSSRVSARRAGPRSWSSAHVASIPAALRRRAQSAEPSQSCASARVCEIGIASNASAIAPCSLPRSAWVVACSAISSSSLRPWRPSARIAARRIGASGSPAAASSSSTSGAAVREASSSAICVQRESSAICSRSAVLMSRGRARVRAGAAGGGTPRSRAARRLDEDDACAARDRRPAAAALRLQREGARDARVLDRPHRPRALARIDAGERLGQRLVAGEALDEHGVEAADRPPAMRVAAPSASYSPTRRCTARVQ